MSSQAAGLTEFNPLNAVLTGSNGLQSDQSANGQVSSGLTVDGVFGAATKAALKSVQRQLGLTQDGVYGSQTNHALLWKDNTSHCYSFPFAW